MTQYFFDIYDELVVRDEVGLEFETLDAARQEAVVAISSIAKEVLPHDGQEKHIAIKVRSGSGDVVLTVEIKFSVSFGG